MIHHRGGSDDGHRGKTMCAASCRGGGGRKGRGTRHNNIVLIFIRRNNKAAEDRRIPPGRPGRDEIPLLLQQRPHGNFARSYTIHLFARARARNKHPFQLGSNWRVHTHAAYIHVYASYKRGIINNNMIITARLLYKYVYKDKGR